jgi:hypothetical protein
MAEPLNVRRWCGRQQIKFALPVGAAVSKKRALSGVFSLTHFCFETAHIRAAKVGLKLLDIFAHVLEPGIEAK